MNTPKKHHFVPQMLLRRFCDKDGKLWCFSKKTPQRGVTSASPENVFYINDFYTLRENGEKNISLEILFSRLESPANIIIEKICLAARVGKLPKLTALEKQIWDIFFYFQWKRTPDSISSTLLAAEFERLTIESLDEFERQFGPVAEREREHFLAETTQKQLRQNARVRATADIGGVVPEIITNMGIFIAVIAKAKKSFVIGSKPIVKITPPDETRLGAPGVEAWLPISAEVAVCLIPERGAEIVHVLEDDRLIRSLNAATFRQSTLIAGRSEALVNSLVNQR